MVRGNTSIWRAGNGGPEVGFLPLLLLLVLLLLLLPLTVRTSATGAGGV